MTHLSTEEAQLLRQYVDTRSDEAFGRLVDRYVNIVYAAARRQVRDGDLARDVTQAVFLVLAEKAAELDPARPISGWLLQVTRYAAANAVRARARRAHHEQRAAEMLTKTSNHDSRDDDADWRHLSPLLDEGMGRLRSKDRDVLLLRFFEQKTAREVAEAMGISEDAAEKRISRAVGKLRDFFQRRGVAVSLVALAATLAANSAEAAPVGLTATIAATSNGAAAAATLSASSLAKGTVITMGSAKAKTLLVASLGLLLVGGGAVAVTKMVASPSPRRIVATSTVSPAATVAPTTAAVPGATLQFSQGSTVELIGISDAPTDNTRWWAADGTPITPPARRPGGGLRGSSNQPSYQLLVRKTDGPAGGAGMSVMLTGVTVAGSSSTEQGGPGGTRQSSYMFSLWDNPAPPIVDVSVSLAYGPWTDEQRFALKSAPPSSQPASASGADITIDSVRALDKQTTEVGFHFSPAATLARGRGAQEEQLYLTDTAGRQFFAQSWTASAFGRNVLQFKAPRDGVVALVYRHRPYETREIRNVSLIPGQKTVVAISDPVRR